MIQRHIILIHGTFANGEHWQEMVVEFKRRGFTVHTPTLRYHDLPWQECARKVGAVSLFDYLQDLSVLVRSLDSPPIIAGHSLGGLLAQLLAARHPHSALILFSPAPAAGIPPLSLSTIRIFYRHFLHWGFWKEPIYPPPRPIWTYGIANQQPSELQEEGYQQLRPDSGRAYFEMVFPFLDRQRAAKVNFDAIQTPVLVFGGSKDRTVVPRVSQKTASRYRLGTYVELDGSII